MYDFSHNKDFIINISKFSQTEMVEWRKFQDLEWYARITNLEIVYIWEFRYFLTIFENTFKIMMLGANDLGENVNEMSFKRKNGFGRTIRTTAFILLLERSIIKIRLLKKKERKPKQTKTSFFHRVRIFPSFKSWGTYFCICKFIQNVKKIEIYLKKNINYHIQYLANETDDHNILRFLNRSRQFRNCSKIEI